MLFIWSGLVWSRLGVALTGVAEWVWFRLREWAEQDARHARERRCAAFALTRQLPALRAPDKRIATQSNARAHVLYACASMLCVGVRSVAVA